MHVQLYKCEECMWVFLSLCVHKVLVLNLHRVLCIWPQESNNSTYKAKMLNLSFSVSLSILLSSFLPVHQPPTLCLFICFWCFTNPSALCLFLYFCSYSSSCISCYLPFSSRCQLPSIFFPLPYACMFLSVFFSPFPASLTLSLCCPICWSICVFVFALITV